MCRRPIRRKCSKTNENTTNQAEINNYRLRTLTFSAKIILATCRSQYQERKPEISLRIGKMHPLPKNNKDYVKHDFTNYYEGIGV